MKLKINHIDVPVLPLPNEEAEKLRLFGYYDTETRQILIESGISPPEQARVLLHEIIHAIFYIHQIKTKRFNQEAICQTLDVPLATLFRNNPHLSDILDKALNHSIPIV